MDPILLPSGAKLVITRAPFQVANGLLKVVARELTRVQFDLDLGNIELSNIGAKDLDTLKNAIFQLVQSEAVEEALNRCLARCLYNGQKIVAESTFESEEARGDYYPVVWEVMQANLLPFLGSLLSRLPKKGSLSSSSPGSESESPKNA